MSENNIKDILKELSNNNNCSSSFDKDLFRAKRRTKDEAIEDNTICYIDAATNILIKVTEATAIILIILAILWILLHFNIPYINSSCDQNVLKEDIELIFTTVIPPVLAFIVGHMSSKQ